MKPKPAAVILMVCTALAWTSCAAFESLVEREHDIALTDLPATVRTAAQQAVADLVITEAEVESVDGRNVYEIEGNAGQTGYQLKIDQEGNVLAVNADAEADDD